MQSLSYSAQINSRELSLLYSKYTGYSHLNKTDSETQPVNGPIQDILEISPAVHELQKMGLKLNSSNLIEENSNLKFQYNFSNSLIQVQSSGNYDIYSNKGSLSFSVSMTKLLSKNVANKVSVLPKEVKIKLDFSLTEIHESKERKSLTKSPDIMQIVLKIMTKISDIVKDGQDKDIKLSFEDFKTFLSFMSADKGKLAKTLLQFLEIIAKSRNPNDKDGKRDSVMLVIPDKETTINYNETNFSLKMTNISMEFSYIGNPENQVEGQTVTQKQTNSPSTTESQAA